MWGNWFAVAEPHCTLYGNDGYKVGLEMVVCPLQIEDLCFLKSVSLCHCELLLCSVQNKYLYSPLHST